MFAGHGHAYWVISKLSSLRCADQYTPISKAGLSGWSRGPHSLHCQLSKMFRRPSLCHLQFPFLQSVSSFYCPIFGVHSSPVSAITGFAPSSAKRGRFLVNADPARALYLSVSLSVCRRQAPSSRENLLKLTGWTVAAASSPTFSAMSNCPRSRILGRGRYIDENTSPRWMVSRWPNRPGARGNDLFLPEGDTANFECKSSSQS